MRKMPIAALLFTVMSMLPLAAAHAETITTTYTGGNANDGIMFDVDVLGGPVRLESIDLNSDFGTFDYEVWYRQGGTAGQQLNMSSWTLLSSFSGLQSNGIGTSTTLDIADLMLTAGTTYGLYVTDTGAFSTQYTNSLAPSGSVQTSNGSLAIKVGYGIQYAFADSTANRAFNGGLTYSSIASAVPEPASWMMMIAGFGVIGGMLRRHRPATLKAA